MSMTKKNTDEIQFKKEHKINKKENINIENIKLSRPTKKGLCRLRIDLCLLKILS